MRGLPAVRLRHPEHGEVEEEEKDGGNTLRVGIGAVAKSQKEDPRFAKTRLAV